MNRYRLPVLCLFVCLLAVSSLRRDDVAAQSTPNNTPVQLDALIEGHHQHGGTVRATNGTPTVAVNSPDDGATINTRDVEISFSTLDHVVGPIGTDHIHLHLDGDPLPYMMFNGDDPAQFGQQAVLFDFDLTSRATWVDANTVRFNALSNGLHTVRIHLVDNQHNIYDNVEATTEFSFYVDVPSDTATVPQALVFVKEQTAGQSAGRVFDSSPDVIGDLYKLEPPVANGTLTQLTDVAKDGGGIVSPEVSFDGQRLLFSMREDENATWKIYEMNVDGTGLRQVTHDPDNQRVNDTDPAYLPNGQIIFASDRLKQRDEYDRSISTQLWVAELDGTGLRLVEPNPSHMVDPQVLRDGRVVFGRWDHLAHSNHFSLWHMNPDGSSGFVFYGGVSPRGSDRLGNAQGMEPRQLDDGTMVGIFTNRNETSGKLGIFDNRNGDLEDLPRPILVGPADGFYRTPNNFTTQKLVYSYSPNTDIDDTQYGLYTADWSAEEILIDDTTERTPAEGSGTNPAFHQYSIELDAASRVFIEVTGSADSNGDANDDDLWLTVDGEEYRHKLERRLDGDLIEGGTDTFRIDVDMAAGVHSILLHTNQTPTIQRVRVVRAARPGTPALIYDDPTTNEISPIPIRATTLPPVYPSRLNPDLSYGTFLVRDVSLRGDFRQPNHNTFYDGDPDFHFHLDLDKLQGLRVFQSVELTSRSEDIYAGAHGFDPVRVLGLVKPNEYGTTVFQAPAGNVTAWDLVGENGESVVKERVWSLVQPGEVRACGGCHVPQLPYTQRDIGAIPAPVDLNTRGEVVDFMTHALPALQENCSSCHTEDSPAGGLTITGTRENYDYLLETGRTSLDTDIIQDGNARNSFLFQLLIGNARGDDTRQTRIDAINDAVDHMALLDKTEIYDLATWIDLGAAFAYLPDGVHDGTPQVSDLNSSGSTNGGISIEFNAPADRATVNDETVTVEQIGGSIISGSFVWGNHKHVTFMPDAPLTAGEYRITISEGVRDVHKNEVGNALQPFAGTFTIGNSADSTPPTITEQPPTQLSPLGQLLFRFDEMIDPGTLSELNLWVTKENGEWVDGGIGVSADSREVAFAPRDAFEVGQTYICNIGDSITDLSGNALASGESFSFTVVKEPTEQQISHIADRATRNYPEGIAVSRDGTQLLVANEGNDSLSLFDTATHDLITVIEGVGDNPGDVLFSADNKFAYVLNWRDDDFRVVRLSDGQQLVDLDFADPSRIVLNDAGTRLYITERGGINRIHEIDVDSDSSTFGQVVRSLDTTYDPIYLAISADALYYARNHRVVEIPFDVWAERRVIETPYSSSGEIAVSPDGRQLVQTARHDDRLMFVDLVAGQATGTAIVGDYPETVAWSPDGSFVFIGTRGESGVQVFDMGSFEVAQTLHFGRPQSPEDVALSPDGTRLYVSQDGAPGRLHTFLLADNSDATPPQVTAFSPADDERNVPVHAALVVDFSEAINRASLTEQTLVLEQNGVTLGVDIDISNDNQRVIIQPKVTLLPNSDYTLRVTTGVEDVVGNNLAAESTTTFRTAMYAAEQSFRLANSTSEGVYSPRGIAVTADGSRILFANYYSNEVRVLDGTTLEEIARIPVGHRVRNIAITPGGTKAFISRPEVDDLLIIDLNDNTLVDLDPTTDGVQGIPVGRQPDSFTLHPTQPILYVANVHSSDISVIDTVNNVETARWLAFNGEDRDAHAVALTPDGSKLIVIGQHRLAVLDATTGEQLKLYTGLPSWAQYDLMVTKDGNQVWFTSSDTDEIVGFDLRSEEIVARVIVGDYPTWLTVSPDGETIYVNVHSDGAIAVVDWRTATVINTLHQAGRSYRVVLSADGRTLYQSSEADTALLVWELDDTVDKTPPTIVSYVPADIATGVSVISPIDVTFSEPIDRSSVNEWTFALLETNGRAVRSMTDAEVQAAALSGDYVFSNDNRTVTFVPHAPLLASTNYTLRLFGISDAAGNWLETNISHFTTATPLTPPALTKDDATFDADEPWGMVLSPDKRTLAVSSNYWNDVHLIDQTTFEQIGDAIDVGTKPRALAYSADGVSLFVGLDQDEQVVALEIASGLVTRVFENVPDPTNMLLSADGETLYVSGDDSGGVYTIDLLTGVVELSQAMTRPGRLAYAPDGTLYVGADDALWRLNETSGVWQMLETDGGFNRDVAFSADGRHAFVSQAGRGRLRVIDLELWRVERDLQVGNDPRDMVQSADNRLIVLLSSNDGMVQVIDTLTQHIVQSYTLTGAWLNTLVWDEPTGNLYVGENWENIVHRFTLTYDDAPLPTPTPDTPPTLTTEPQSAQIEVDAVLPQTGVNNLPNEVYIYGDGFTAATKAFLGNTPLATTFINQTYLLAVVPTGAQVGVHDVRVSADGQHATINDSYTVIDGTVHDDLTSMDSELWLNPVVPVAGQETEMGIRIHRQGGTATIDNVLVRFYEGSTVLAEKIVSVDVDGFVDTSIRWVPELSGSRNIWVHIDPLDEYSESVETNNIISRKVIVMLPPIETEPPIVTAFSIKNGAEFTSNPNVTLRTNATDSGSGVDALLFIEFVYNQNTNTWVPIHNSGWIDYGSAATINWLLSPKPGAKYIQVWAADEAGNISLQPQEAFINLTTGTDTLAAGQARLYRRAYELGETVSVCLTTYSGDGDLYVWPPNWPTEPVVFSITEEAADCVSFAAPVAGVYQIEAYGYVNSSLSIDFDVAPSRSVNNASANKTALTAPVVSSDDTPTEQQALPAPPVVITVPTAIGASGYAAILRQSPLLVAFALLILGLTGIVFKRR